MLGPGMNREIGRERARELKVSMMFMRCIHELMLIQHEVFWIRIKKNYNFQHSQHAAITIWYKKGRVNFMTRKCFYFYFLAHPYIHTSKFVGYKQVIPVVNFTDIYKGPLHKNNITQHKRVSKSETDIVFLLLLKWFVYLLP